MDEYLELDLAVHVAIYHAAGNALITLNLLNLIDKVRWMTRASTAWPMRIQEAYEEVDRILRALERRDAVAAREAMRRHIQATIDFCKHREGLARPADTIGAGDCRGARRVAGVRSRSSR